VRKEQELELDWWGDCGNTFHEEQKQLVYAQRMALVAEWTGGHPPAFDMGEKSIVDIGGGPVSLLLKTRAKRRMVVDPCPYPQWVWSRYLACGIESAQQAGEEFEPDGWRADETWIYNVLQHVEDPEQLIYKVRRYSDTIRLFEWIDIPAYDGHPHELHEHDLYHWLGGGGMVEDVKEAGAVGRAFYGVFSTK
jgi:hypothetical protein